MQEKETTLRELIHLTKSFIGLADELYRAGKLSHQEYTELTYIKKDFLKKAYEDQGIEQNKEWRVL